MLGPLSTPVTSELIDVNDVKIEVQRRGKGAPLLLLPGEEALEIEARSEEHTSDPVTDQSRMPSSA